MWTLMALVACGTTTTTPQQSTPQTVLAAADAHDGTVDKTVSQCTGCGLGMAGDPAHAVQHEGYELHFCSGTCKGTFEKDPAAGIERLEAAVQNTH